jgi:hypothetical protein
MAAIFSSRRAPQIRCPPQAWHGRGGIKTIVLPAKHHKKKKCQHQQGHAPAMRITLATTSPYLPVSGS